MSVSRLLMHDTSSDDERPAKARRIARACLQCRARKQRCSTLSESMNLQTPCKRCQKLCITCSFETDTAPALNVSQSPSRLAQLVVELHNRVNQHEKRILELEDPSRRYSATNNQPTLPGTAFSIDEKKQSVPPSPSQTGPSHSPQPSLVGIDLGPPFATLRSLRALAEEEAVPDRSHQKAQFLCDATHDPITHGILSYNEIQRAIDIYFRHCHPSAPVLNEETRTTWRGSNHSPILILAICSIGARFWDKDDYSDNSIGGAHPRSHDLTKLLDKAVSRLLLRPTPRDVTLDSICVLLLYAQWMPCSREDDDDIEMNLNGHRTTRSRYNEISAWAVLGLAGRYAVLMNLEMSAWPPFSDASKTPSAIDVSRLRVWYNLLTCNFNLMLTSGLPASIDPAPSVQAAQSFASHHLAQRPSDIRVAGLVELVKIVYRALSNCGDISGRKLLPPHLRRLNTELDKWEKSWLQCLRDTDSPYNNLPLTSLRWYRLSLNSASLAPLLSTVQNAPKESSQSEFYQPLKVSLTAASQMLLSLSTCDLNIVFELDSQNKSSFPRGVYHADRGSLYRLYYAVDSTWISYTFAVTFLSLCYIRRVIDESLQILVQDRSGEVSTRLPSSSTSVLARLLRLAVDIFDGVCPKTTFHFARDFQDIIHYAASLVFVSESEDKQSGEEVNDFAVQSLLDLMNDSGVDWAGNLFGEPMDFPDWNMSGIQGA